MLIQGISYLIRWAGPDNKATAIVLGVISSMRWIPSLLWQITVFCIQKIHWSLFFILLLALNPIPVFIPNPEKGLLVGVTSFIVMTILNFTGWLAQSSIWLIVNYRWVTVSCLIVGLTGELIQRRWQPYKFWGIAWQFKRTLASRYFECSKKKVVEGTIEQRRELLAGPILWLPKFKTDAGKLSILPISSTVEFKVEPALGRDLTDLIEKQTQIRAQYDGGLIKNIRIDYPVDPSGRKDPGANVGTVTIELAARQPALQSIAEEKDDEYYMKAAS
jgi:hypothetical protein